MVWEQFGNVMEMVKKVQQNVSQAEEQLKSERIEVSSGDVVKVVVNGQQTILAIELNGKYLEADNTVLLQDLLVATINSALAKSREMHQAAMGKLAGDLNLPSIPGLF
ncbi:YbaB/EbfC family nucleoid-associated protein [Anaeroselena agilis]|uniref:Nucleoid-associated protein Q4T40_07040 n=1 Tax=Anaeroselena agilis TaxID=3063788 RepID=A0ABU3NVZ3_9FIRM|nr:YbaB/EbfC family nucleoid-associated protein [Selenomonadales bacterium 4137-cl]